MSHEMFQFLPPGFDLSLAYHGSYNIALVILSVMMASIAAFSALLITERVGVIVDKKTKRFWLNIGALTMGIGVWSMHFIGMLAFVLPVSVFYDPWITAISVIPAIIGSRCAFHFMIDKKTSFWKINCGGLFMAVGIGTMHYTGMAAMVMESSMYYNLWLFIASIIVAHILATVALYIKFMFSEISRFKKITVHIFSSIMMGCAVSGMHYTAMKSAFYFPLSEMTHGSIIPVSVMQPTFLALIIACLSIILMGITIVSSYLSLNLRLKGQFIREELEGGMDRKFVYLNIRQRLNLALITNLLLIIILGTVGIYSAHELDKKYSRISLLQSHYEVINNIESMIYQSEEMLLNIVTLGRDELIPALLDKTKVINTTFELYRKEDVKQYNLSDKFFKNKIKPFIDNFGRDISKAIQLYQENRIEEAKATYLTQVENSVSHIETFIKNRSDAEKNSINEAIIEVTAIQRNISIMYGILFFAIIVINFILNRKTAHSINEPLNNLVSVTKLIGSGNYSKKANEDSRDEFGELGASFNEMITQLDQKRKEMAAINQNSKDNEQQLKASNQQLRTNEQKVKNINKQLVHNEQEIKLSNLLLKTANEASLKAKNGLEEKLSELERFHRITVDRELEMVKLKKMVNGLLEELGRPGEFKIGEIKKAR